MKRTALILFCFISSFAIISANYDGYKVYQVIPKTMKDVNLLKMFKNNKNFDFWSDLRALNHSVDMMVAKSSLDSFENLLNSNKVEYKIIIEDVAQTIDRENKRQKTRKQLTKGNVTFEEFMRFDEITDYLNSLATDYPNIATTEIYGQSFEGRNLTLIKISSGGENKPIIFCEAAIHAREWLAPSVALYIMNQLVETAGNSYLFRDIDWVIVPVTNPDGYEYTHTNERLWRVTRSPNTICTGADANRNFGPYWKLNGGSSSWQCDEDYAGREKYSEVEARALRDYVLSQKENIKLAISIHSYGQYFLYPWGHVVDLPDNVSELEALAKLFKDAVYAVGGTTYTSGTTANVLYFASGTVTDFSKGEAGIDLAYTLELPGGGDAGFNPPASRIVPVVQETWEGFKALHSYIQLKFVTS